MEGIIGIPECNYYNHTYSTVKTCHVGEGKLSRGSSEKGFQRYHKLKIVELGSITPPPALG